MTGELAGKLELLTNPASSFYIDAKRYAAERFKENGRDFHAELPSFTRGLSTARSGARQTGRYQRHEMPVIETEDLPDLRAYLTAKGVEFKEGETMAWLINPMQRQIYVDKAVNGTATKGASATVEFLRANPLVTDYTANLFDGHHRWLSACTISALMPLPQFEIGESIERILPDLLEFSDQRHPRNE